MTNFKREWKRFWKLVWEFLKNAFPAGLMFFTASSALMMLTMKTTGDIDGATEIPKWTDTALLWTLVCGLAACAYQGFMMYAYGGTHYEMLVAGNIKRTADSGYRDSKHKEEKEYRAWKGFVVGAFIGIYPLITGILFGANQAKISAGDLTTEMGILLLFGFFFSGWSIIPFYLLNNTGIYVSYYLSCLFAIVPVLVAGVFYILGAYGRRGKAIKKQQEADKASAMQKEKPKKINYGGLPGTKPNKKRKK